MDAAREDEQVAIPGLDDDPLCEVGVGGLRLRIGDEFHRHHGAGTADLADLVELLRQVIEAVLHLLADDLRPMDEVFLLDHVQHGQRRGRPDRGSAVGTSDTADVDGVHDRRLADDRREGVAASQALGHRDEVGLDPGPLVGEEGARATYAGLHLINDEDDPVLIADRS